MDMTQMEIVTTQLQKVKPRRYVFVYCSMAGLFNCFAGHLPHAHQKQEKGGFAYKVSREAVTAFKSCFPKGEIPEIKIRG